MKGKTKIISLAVCGVLAVGLGALVLTNSANANAAAELLVPQEYKIEKEYTYGETFNVPAPSNVRIKTGNVETNAVSVEFRFPDGTAKTEGNYTLDKNGVYELTYYNANGVAATQSFTVNKNYYNVGEGATVSYVNNLAGVAGKQGISVTLKERKTFTYNKTLDLNDYAGKELEVCTVYPLFRTDENVNPTASTLSVKLVDCYDDSKFVEYYIWCGDAGQGVYYAGAGASTQGLTGLEQNKNRPHEMITPYDGQMYKVHRPTRYQSKTAWGAGIASRTNQQLIQKGGVGLLWDLSTNQMKARNGVSAQLITDIDSAEIYGENALNVDTFFTTGEVYLQIEAFNYNTTTFDFCLEKVFGDEGEALQNGKLEDKKAPQLSVDVETTEGNSIYLQNGKSVVLPKISQVLDYNYYGDAKVQVYRNYGKVGQALLNIENGVFTPTMLGNYTAVYTATDGYGNEGKYLLEMVVLDEQNIVYEQAATDKFVAARANVLPYIAANGLNKTVRTEVVVTAPNGENITLDYNGVDGYEYVPASVGEYTVTYLFTDNVYEERYSYKVECVDENAATFQSPFTFPAYFMKGASYSVAPITAYTAGNGKFNENAATVSVSVDGGEYQTLSAAQMQAYKVDANQTLRFKASYGDNFVESKLYSVVDVGYGKKTTEKDYLQYFQGNYISAEMTDSGARYAFDGNAELQFVNTVSSASFKANFTVSGEKVDEIKVTLRDARNPDRNYVTYTYQKQEATPVSVTAAQFENGKLVYQTSVYTKQKELLGNYSIAYSSTGVTTGEVVVAGIKAFAENSALVEMSVSGVTGGCAVTVSNLNNQSFATSMRESKPQMSYAESNGVLESGGIYEISPCYASAVLNSVLTKDVKVTVLMPNGEVATSTDNVLLDGVTADRIYRVKLAQVGQYRINYEVSCVGSSRTNGQETLSDDDYYIVNVSEGVAPTIAFKDGSNTQTTINLSVGSTHTVKEFTVTDNVSSSENIKVYTMIMDKAFILEENGYNVDSYTFNNVGEFVVYVLAYDELGNSSALYYNVIVS